jgi:NIMA (never in mitosis gene a)-related kinase
VEAESDGSLAVIKKIDIQKLSDEEKRETIKEAKILEVLNHPNIIRFKEVYKTKKGQLCIVMDYADGGDLQSKIKEQKNKGGYLDEPTILNWFTQICLAMKHCHDRKILHRDLKAQNIFMQTNGIVKLGDFGIAKVLNTTVDHAVTIVGTPYYLSPEII